MQLSIEPNKQAAEFIRGKAAALPGVFGRMLPDIRARAFTVARVTDFDVLRDIADKIATLPEGGDWREIRKGIAAEISPFMDPEEGGSAASKAELILRANGFQAYAAARYGQQAEMADALPYWQYLTVGDKNVRDSHAALDGKVFPADDPFWQTHYPPWDYGCRCIVRAMSRAEAGDLKEEDADKEPSERRVLDGKQLEKAREGYLRDGKGVERDIRPPDQTGDPLKAYRFRPGDLRPDLDQLRERYTPEVFAGFSDAMRSANIQEDGEPRQNAWEWLWGDLQAKDRQKLQEHARKTGNEMAVIRDWKTGETVKEIEGDENRVKLGDVYEKAASEGRALRGAHVHPNGDRVPSPMDVRMALHAASAGEDVIAGIATTTVRLGKYERTEASDRLMTRMESWDYALEKNRKSRQDWVRYLKSLCKSGVLTYKEDMQ